MVGMPQWAADAASRTKDEGRAGEASGKLPKQHLVTMDLADSAAREGCAVAERVGGKLGSEARQQGSRGLPEAIPNNAREMGLGEEGREAGNERLGQRPFRVWLGWISRSG